MKNFKLITHNNIYKTDFIKGCIYFDGCIIDGPGSGYQCLNVDSCTLDGSGSSCISYDYCIVDSPVLGGDECMSYDICGVDEDTCWGRDYGNTPCSFDICWLFDV